jgi:hypothetical protein
MVSVRTATTGGFGFWFLAKVLAKKQDCSLGLGLPD